MIRPAPQLRSSSGKMRPAPLTRRPSKVRSSSLVVRKAPRAMPRPTADGEGRPWARQVFLIGLLVLAQVIFLRSELFKVRVIDIQGNRHVPNRLVVERAGLKPSMYLWEVPARKVASELEGLNQVRSATVRYGLPGRVRIELQERSPVFCVSTRQSKPEWFAVDEEGMVLRPLPKGSNSLPRLLVDGPVLAGTRLDAATLFTVLKAVSWVGSALPAAVWYYYVDDRGGVTIKTTVARSPLEVHLGQLDRMEYKVKVLGALLDRLAHEKQKVLAVDLRYSSPVVKLRVAPPPPSDG